MSDPSPRILLAEDDLFFAARILSVLGNLGYRTETARTKEEALQKTAGDPPALVILNLASARLGGIALVRDLKAMTTPPRVLAFLSHVKIPAVRDEILRAGADKLCANSAISLRLPDLVRDVLDGRGPQEEE